MKNFKSHFSYSKDQRNGILFLIVLVLSIQTFIYCFEFKNESDSEISPVSENIQKQLDSLLLQTNKTYVLKPFNPNYLTDYKAYQLGMSVEEIDRLLNFRKTEKYINSVADFKKVTHVSDSLLNTIAPYFKFPDWVLKNKLQKKKVLVQKIIIKDINKATVKELDKIKGIGEKRANTILSYRDKLQGFSFIAQLDEVWGLTDEVLVNLKKEFQVLSNPIIIKLNVNTASAGELNKIVYINYKQAKSIVEYRKEVAEIQNLAELKTISNFPVDKFDLISLYLHAQ
ncbi:competence ComEA-like helix-hairpin-helix protein [Wenyingzhuangia heitensis]|uniref:Competence ComEA-like helix-hairpin-helix protein n=1 Tax=Wenyingzhuangia heitensis TaxID=1487859 RepID=A0ABX0U8X5_9FLAO|nr:helix-hairpin-helix domain-containing protein [Wenyingzhuangia heitensis]NIJ44658.1 competence ComEA-like helix-hairpin-helix protein [Wenyingzhuangia heitensis]